MSRFKQIDQLPDGICAGCRFWEPRPLCDGRPIETELQVRMGFETISLGRCHKRSPQSVIGDHLKEWLEENGLKAGDVDPFHAVWPETWATDWCGDFEKGLTPLATTKEQIAVDEARAEEIYQREQKETNQ
jgi:hypothetical protein